MTTYLTKQDEGKTLHYRVTQEENGYRLVEGQFYKWIQKKFMGYGIAVGDIKADDRARITADVEGIIATKIAEGYVLTPFTQSKENDYDVYDKAKYHCNNEFPKGLSEFQCCVHTGMYVSWLIDNEMLDTEQFKPFETTMKNRMNKVKSRKQTGAAFYEEYLDGVLGIESLTEEGNRFSMQYFDLETGTYLADYEETLVQGLPSFFHVADSWENYEKIRPVLDRRYAEWKKTGA